MNGNSCYAVGMEQKTRIRFSKLIAIVSIISVLCGCTPVTGTPTATDVAMPVAATPKPGQSSATPPNVFVISPTPGVPQSTLVATSGPAFCASDLVQAAIEALGAALKNQDGAALAEVIDPVEGLDIYYRLANPAVRFTPDQISGLFTSLLLYNWGNQAGSGLPVEGTFSGEILPKLLDVFDRSFTRACQDLKTGVGTGPTTALVDWPAEYAGMPFVALFRPPEPPDNELDWRTWAVGFTVVAGQPKIRVLVQYVWEI